MKICGTFFPSIPDFRCDQRQFSTILLQSHRIHTQPIVPHDLSSTVRFHSKNNTPSIFHVFPVPKHMKHTHFPNSLPAVFHRLPKLANLMYARYIDSTSYTKAITETVWPQFFHIFFYTILAHWEKYHHIQYIKASNGNGMVFHMPNEW